MGNKTKKTSGDEPSHIDIYLVRHAESTFNAFDDPSKNVPITIKGVRQATDLRGHFDLILCSPLLRTRQTLEHSKITYETLEFSPDTREIVSANCDVLEEEVLKYETIGSTIERCKRLHSLIKERWIALNPTGSQSPQKKILVVSHANFLYHFTQSYCTKTVNLANAELVKMQLKM